MIRSYRMYSDPSHGWLRVNIKELETLNIGMEVSAYSYISKDGQFVFLEEDRDMQLFLRAKEQAGEWPITIHETKSEGRSKIRSYRRYYKPVKWEIPK